MPAKKSSKRPASKKTAGQTRARAAAKGAAGESRAAGKSGGALSVAGFLRLRPRAEDAYSAVFLINPQESTPESLRVAWPETCLACGNWFDFPASAVESVTPLGVEECCRAPFPKAALRIKSSREDLIAMLRSHLAGTIGSELASQAPPETRGLGVTTFGEEVCGSEGSEGSTTRDIQSGTAGAVAAGLELSGPQWVARFPTSNSIFDCKPPFLDRISKFHQALVDAGAQIKISATLRPPERAYLMHFSSKISRGLIAPAQVPPMPGVSIRWDHGNLAKSKDAATQMVKGYGIAFPPALHSRHTQGLAIDMTITWAGTLKIKDASGAVKNIGAPQSGNSNSALHGVGASYGVVKLSSDPPHWSSDGH